MSLLIPLTLAKALLYCFTLWNAFKALKVPKQRRKIPRPVLKREASTINEPQTEPSSDPLSPAQKARRKKIKETTTLCLVWVIWTHSKRFLDWVSWAIPFYDELNLMFLIWLILMGPSAADTVFKHTIGRIATRYEKSFDSVLGTTHDALQITMYLITCGPKTLSLKWKRWKARQFNKSLLSDHNTAPTSRFTVSNSYHSHFQPTKPKPPPVPPTNRVSLSSKPAVSTSTELSNYLSVPERKPTLSRKLSAGYKRAVSNSRPKGFLGDAGLLNTRHVSTKRAIYPLDSRSTFSLRTSCTNRSSVLDQSSTLRHSSKENIPQVSQPSLADRDEGNNSIVIHDECLMSLFEGDQKPKRVNDLPVKEVPRKRFRKVNDDIDAIALRKAKKALRSSSTHSVKMAALKNKKLKLKDTMATSAPVFPQPQQAALPSHPPTSIQSCTIPRSSVVEDPQHQADDLATWPLSSNSALPAPSSSSSPSKVPPPKVQRRLHNPDEPLPPPSSNSFQLPIDYEQALGSVRTLQSAEYLPTINQSNGWLGDRRPSSSPSSLTKNKKIQPLFVARDRLAKKSSSSLAKKKEISGKLGQQRALEAHQKVNLLKKPSASSSPIPDPY